MNDKIKVSNEKVREAASNILASANRLNAILDSARQNMQIIGDEDVWSSESAANFKTKFDTLAKRFEGFYENMKNYSQFLTNTVNMWEASDSAIDQDIEGNV